MQRKHRKQMSVTEIKTLEHIVHSMPSWVCKTKYLAGRQQERSISRLEVFKCLRYGVVIEYKDDGRVVMRNTDGICVVAHLATHTVVTAWYNDPSDQHWTLDLSQYRWMVNLIPYIHQERI